MNLCKPSLCSISLKNLAIINSQSTLSNGNWRRFAGHMIGKELGDHMLRVALATEFIFYTSNQGGVNGKVGESDGGFLPSLLLSGNHWVTL